RASIRGRRTVADDCACLVTYGAGPHGQRRRRDAYCRPPIRIGGMEGLGLLRDGWTVIVLRRRVAACKASEHNQSEERLIGPHDVPLPEFAYWLCIRACLSVNDRNTQFYGQARRAPLGHLGRIGFDLMLASLAPNDRPNAGGGSVDERHRRAGLGLHRAQRADSVDVAMINVTVISYRPS